MPFHTSVRLLVILRGLLLTAVVIVIAVLVHQARAVGGSGLSARVVDTIYVALALLFIVGFASSIVLAEATLARANARIRRLRERATLAAHGIPLTVPDPTRDALGKFDHALCAIADEVQAANERATSALALKSQFVATVSHELRTPLSGIIGMGEILLRSRLDSDQREIAQSLHDSSTALLTIINDILDFSKLEAGRVQLESMEFAPNQLVDNVVDLVNRAAAAKPLTLMTYFAPDVPAKLGGDAGRLRQILLNLIGNAVKFTEVGHVLVSVDVVEKSTSNAAVRWRVADSGIGMTPEAQRKIFEPFAQGDASTTRRFGGSGLGLAICKGFVELMNGSIEITSALGQGTTVSFTVPLQIIEIASAPPKAGPLEDIRALVLSNDSAVRTTIQQYAAAWKMCIVALSDDHSEALTTLRSAARANDPFRVVIVDCSSMGERCSLCAAIGREKDLAGTRIAVLNAYNVDCAGEIASKRRKPLLQSEVYDSLVNALLCRPTGDDEADLVQAIRDAQVPNWKIHVLIAEDNAINQKVAQRQLQILGASSIAVANGADAVAAIEREPFDVVLMDCNMPVMDGFTAAREIRSREAAGSAHIPIVAMTANATSRDRDDCLAAGMDDYVSKPVMIEPLREVLERVLVAVTPTMGES